MFALIDANNFYASCEIAFDVSLRGKALIVASNNDGCTVARSPEAKALGIKMTEPVYQVKKKHPNVCVRSSNYELYADMSSRIVNILTASFPVVEPYSVDECFAEVTGIAERVQLAHSVRAQVRQWTGLPVCVGIGATKTRAKLANHIAKKDPSHSGVFDIEAESPEQSRARLNAIDVEEVWGIGDRLANRLRRLGVKTVQAFIDAESEWVLLHSSVVLQRTHEELRGRACFPMELLPAPKKQLVVSRSFGQETDSFNGVREAALTYASRAGEKLRAEGLLARYLQVFIHTNGFRTDRPQYSNSYTVKLPTSTDDTLVFASAVDFALKRIYRDGYRYQKAGIMLAELTPKAQRQLAMFVDPLKIERRSALNSTIDKINAQFGRGALRLAASGIERPWQMRRDHLSKRYTTRWSDLAVAYAR